MEDLLPWCTEMIRVMNAIAQEIESIGELQVRTSAVGRPSKVIESTQLGFFVDNCFKVEEMALLLNVSKRTVERKLHAHGLSRRNYTVILN